MFFNAAPGVLDGVALLHAGDDAKVGAGVPVQMPHDADLELVPQTLLASVLAAELPASVRILGLVSVAVGVDCNLQQGSIFKMPSEEET